MLVRMLVRMLVVLTPMLLAGFWQRPLLLPTTPLNNSNTTTNIRCGEISKIDLIKGIRTCDPEILALLGHGINYGHGSEGGSDGNPNPTTTTANAASASASAASSRGLDSPPRKTSQANFLAGRIRPQGDTRDRLMCVCV
jgi:hypothetical protein